MKSDWEPENTFNIPFETSYMNIPVSTTSSLDAVEEAIYFMNASSAFTESN